MFSPPLIERWNGHLGSSTSTEPPAKKLRVSDNFRDCLYGVVGSEIGRLAAGDAAKWAAYDKLRAEVVDKLADSSLTAELRKNGAFLLSSNLRARLGQCAQGYLHALSPYAPETPNKPVAVITPVPVPRPSAYLPRKSATPVPIPKPPAHFLHLSHSPQIRVPKRNLDRATVPPGVSTTPVARPRNESRVPIPAHYNISNSTTDAALPAAPIRGTDQVDAREESSPQHGSPPTTSGRCSQINRTSPEYISARAHARDGREVSAARASDWTLLTTRPYKSASWRQELASGTREFLTNQPDDLKQPEVVHVDFTSQEVQGLLNLLRSKMGLGRSTQVKSARKELLTLLQERHTKVLQAISNLPRKPIRGRNLDDIRAFLSDLDNDRTKKRTRASKDPVILSVEQDSCDRQGALTRSSRVNSLLFAREVAGHRGYGSMRRREHFTNEFRKCREDDLQLRAEWANCAGDIATITWVSNDGFICGTTEHSDAHNQQYNRPGNLALGSCGAGTLKAYPDHRVVRPIIEKGENSTESMRQSQDPWLYTSVVSSDYDERYDRAYTCGFDRTVKIWKAERSGASMSLLGTWSHEGNVNFVVASKHQSGMVATATDIAAEAVRIYHTGDAKDIATCPYRSYSCSRVQDLEGNTVSTDKWAYFPATIQWGRHAEVQHIVAVGYSPRSRTQDDNDIPEDRRGTGEICVWDGLTGERWNILSGSKLNVFEILWHPTQPCFIAATSPQESGVELDATTRTQIRIFALASHSEFNGKAFNVRQTLDCTAIDINELTIMPNCWTYCYITAGCTDGKTYVWDTALGDKPVHVLKHGKPTEEFHGNQESEDTGVKFCAWGNTLDRFYTGSSDGVVKVWNVRTSGKKPLVRNLLEVPGPVSFGQFSPDRSKLVIGDASGRVFYLSVDDEEQKPAQIVSLSPPSLSQPEEKKLARRPQLLTPHPEPDPPVDDEVGLGRAPVDDGSGQGRAQTFLQKQQLVLTGNPTVGAVQGPKYAETGFFRRDFHADDDPFKPLLATQAVLQQEAQGRPRFQRRGLQLKPLRDTARLPEQHLSNLSKQLGLSRLSPKTAEELWKAGAFDLRYQEGAEDSEIEEDSQESADEW